MAGIIAVKRNNVKTIEAVSASSGTVVTSRTCKRTGICNVKAECHTFCCNYIQYKIHPILVFFSLVPTYNKDKWQHVSYFVQNDPYFIILHGYFKYGVSSRFLPP
ncbi:MAG: hypothetical protein BGO43_13045 [Gammaproteobacteria bacterium 39-13]|nr:MAG: hypothetical protein BGO43_13045 [Gammaproteobacteria bacterium 39-13]